MAFPKWLTPAGNLGIVPELAYYDFALDAYDENLFPFQGNLQAGSAVITSVTNLDGLVLGESISGSGIPLGTKITRISKYSNLNISGNTVTISANASATLNAITLSSIPIQYSRVSGIRRSAPDSIPVQVVLLLCKRSYSLRAHTYELRFLRMMRSDRRAIEQRRRR